MPVSRIIPKMKKTNVFNILDMIRTRYVAVNKMIPVTPRLERQLSQPMRLVRILTMGKLVGLGYRSKLTYQFFTFVFKMTKHHGSTATVKWLKAVYVSLQKEIGGDRVKTLRIFEPEIPLPRLTNGLPRIIPRAERALIRKGDIRIIRFWSSLFNLYRVLKIAPQLKLQTITASYTGSTIFLSNMIGLTSSERSVFHQFMEKRSLVPMNFVVSRSASPSNKLSAQGILTDIHHIYHKQPALWNSLMSYIQLTGSSKQISKFLGRLNAGLSLAERLVELDVTYIAAKDGTKLFQPGSLRLKSSHRAHGITGNLHSQFALKDEPAGKVRLFALLDSVTQSTMRPLHDLLFAVLRRIPNDGTFNQEASIKRSMEKAVAANKAYSFDLTAATDRLPAVLTAYIFEQMLGIPGIGKAWLSVMTDRDFYFNEAVAKKRKVSSGPYRYAVGQPMGGLSSWPGLAITHHWIMQIAAQNVYGSNIGWFTQYEILGDDLVIFDELVAQEYLRIMTGLGCEINLTKSINARNRPVFEFAKRTCLGTSIVSGISLGQLRAGWSVGARVANALGLFAAGHINTTSVLSTVLSRYSSSKLAQREHGLGILALLGALFQQGKVPLRTLAHAIVDPSKEDFDYKGEAVGLPLWASLKAAFTVLNSETLIYPFSKEEERDEIFNEYSSEMSTTLLHKALAIARRCYEDQDELVAKGASTLYFPLCHETKPLLPFADLMAILPHNVKLLYIQVENFFVNEVLDLEFAKENPESLFEELEDVCYKHAKFQNVKFSDALEYLNRAESMEFKLTLKEPVSPGKTVIETTPILGILGHMMNWDSVKPKYIKALEFKTAY